jgi:CheY-like chemotaxis protein
MSTRQTILLVEDDPDLLRFADVTLRLGGYRVYTATDGLSALSAARKVRPAVMLLDLRLPGLDGWQVLAVMAEDPVLRDLPVIVVTATADAGSRPLTEAAGVTEYLVKPLSADALLAAVERVLSRPRQRAPKRRP